MVDSSGRQRAIESSEPANRVRWPETARIGVLADTHLTASKPAIPEAVVRGMQSVDLILHAGDISCAAVLELLSSIAPVIAVHGNVDPPDLQAALPADRIVTCGNTRIGVTHGHLGSRRGTQERAFERFSNYPDVQIIVYGHSHIPAITSRGNVLLFNPGSPTQRRAQPRASYGLIEIDGGHITPSLVYL
jgi:putative phosphoesterase